MRKIAIIIFVCIFFSSCSSFTNSNLLNDTVSRENTLMPFYRNGKMGYIDSETLEVVIPEQYRTVEQFKGDFAIVEKRKGKLFIINRNNKKILGTFNHAVLFAPENSDFVFALVGKNREPQSFTRQRYKGIFTSWYTRIEPTKTEYSLYNISIQKKVLDFGRRDYPKYSKYKPRIRFYGNYMTYETNDTYKTFNKDVYEIQNNGSLIKTTMDIDELISKLVIEHNLQFNDINVKYPNDIDYAHDWKFNGFGYFNALDIDKLKENIPDNLELREIHLVGDFIYPLTDKQFFKVFLTTKRNASYPRYTGLYDAIENKWQIPFMEDEVDGRFLYGVNDDWIIYHTTFNKWVNGNFFFNLKTRKKYKNLYSVYYRQDLCLMAYQGYNNRAKEAIIEDF